jgi:hypothetical protein
VKNKKLTLFPLKYVLLLVLIIWPLVHLTLSLKGVINSWKFSGWGMYATVGPKKTRVKTLFLLKNIHELPLLKLRLTDEKDSFVLGKKRALFSLSSIKLNRKEHTSLRLVSQYLRTIPSEHFAKKYIDLKRSFIERKTKRSFPKAILFLSQRRLDPVKKISFLETKVFIYTKGQVKKLKEFKSTETTEKELIEKVNRSLYSSYMRKS